MGKFYPEIYAAILNTGHGPASFLPFLKDHQEMAAKRPPHCDYEAVIASPWQDWDMDVVLKKMGVNVWDFHALVGFESIKSTSGQFQYGSSLRVDLTQGFGKYLSSLRRGRLGESDLLRNTRVLGRMCGPMRFAADCRDHKLLDRLIQWKVSRYDLDAPWANSTRGLYEYISGLKDPSFQGVISALYAGDELLAVNFGMRSQRIFNGMMMAFNPEYTKYSVGQLLLYYMISGYRHMQFDILDVGLDDCQFKRTVVNSRVPVVKGTCRVHTLKERIKSIGWLYRGLFPLVQMGRRFIV